MSDGASETTRAASAPVPDAEGLHVAQDGSDAWSGTLPQPSPTGTDGPFRTLERARDELRQRRTSVRGQRRGGEVVVHAGVFSLRESFALDERDSGAPGDPAVFRAAKGERVILSGGVALPTAAFGRVEDESVRARLVPEARDAVRVADLAALGVTELGDFPAHFEGAPPTPELFFNDRRMTLARWPNEGWATIRAFVTPGSWSSPPNCETKDEGGVFEYEGDRPARWDVGAGVWLHGYWAFDWHDEVVQVKSIDATARRIALATPTRYGVKPRNPSPRRWRAINLIEELDIPGEYFIDRARRRLYLWPPEPMAGARITLSTLNAPLVALNRASHVTLRGLTVEAGLADGIDVTGGHDVRVEACEIRNMRQIAISIEGGAAHRVEACDVHDTGTGGIRLSGGDRRTLTPAGHEVINTHVWRFSINKATSAYALWVQGVGNRAAHNLIHDAPHQAIAIGGNDHVIEYNIIHDVCLETDDCGACYKGRNPSCRGNVIRFNFWHDIGRPLGHGSGAVYFDDGDGGDIVYGNVFLRCCEPGKAAWGAVYSHGGHGILAENNIFVECKRALGSGPWSDERWASALQGGKNCFWPDKLLREVDITRPPYATRYPELADFMTPQPGRPRVSRARLNVMVRCGSAASGNWQVPADGNWETDSDPGFVDAASGDFRLTEDSVVFTKLPGFRAIPFERIGLVKNDLREELATRGGANARGDGITIVRTTS